MDSFSTKTIEEMSQLEAKILYTEKLKPALPQLLGEIKARVLETLDTAHTIRETADLCHRSYHSMRDIITEFEDKGILASTEYVAKRGRAYQVNYINLLTHLSTTYAGQLILAEQGVTVPKAATWSVNKSTVYNEFPEPQGPVLPLQLGHEKTNVFKAILASSKIDPSKNGTSKFTSLFQVGTHLVYHLWYRNYLQTQETETSEGNILAPTAIETRAAMRNIVKQIREYAKMLETIADNELLWGDSPHFESWRVIGDLPLQWAKDGSAAIVDAWQSGHLTAGGLNLRLQKDYEDTRTDYTRDIAFKWIEHQKALNPNKENN